MITGIDKASWLDEFAGYSGLAKSQENYIYTVNYVTK